MVKENHQHWNKKTVMKGSTLLTFLADRGVDVNTVLTGALKQENKKILPTALVNQILEDEHAQLSRHFSHYRPQIQTTDPGYTEALTLAFRQFVIEILIQKQIPKKIVIEKVSDSEIESSELDKKWWTINSLTWKWSKNYDTLVKLIPEYIDLLEESFDNPNPGSADDYNEEDDTGYDFGEDDDESFFGVKNSPKTDKQEKDEDEEEYIPYKFLNTLVLLLEILEGKCRVIGVNMISSSNKKQIAEYHEELDRIISILEHMRKLNWWLFSYYPEPSQSIGVKNKDILHAINIYIEQTALNNKNPLLINYLKSLINYLKSFFQE